MQTRSTENQLNTTLSSSHIRYANGVADVQSALVKVWIKSSVGRGTSLKHTETGAILSDKIIMKNIKNKV